MLKINEPIIHLHLHCIRFSTLLGLLFDQNQLTYITIITHLEVTSIENLLSWRICRTWELHVKPALVLARTDLILEGPRPPLIRELVKL